MPVTAFALMQVELGKQVLVFGLELARRTLNSTTGAKAKFHEPNAAATGCKRTYQYDNYKLHTLHPFPSNLTTQRDMRYTENFLHSHRSPQVVEQ